MRPHVLVYLYRRRLRVHAVQELLASLGVAVAVALVFAVIVASNSVAGSAAQVVRAIAGPANLQLRARDDDGFEESLLARVQRLAGVRQAAPLLEQIATVTGPSGRRTPVDVAGTDVGLATLQGLAHSLPIAALSPGALGISRATADALGIATVPAQGTEAVSLELRGRAHPMAVSAILGPEAVGALSQARVAVMPLGQLQALAGLEGRITRILVETRPGHEAAVAAELRTLAGGRLTVARTDEDVALLRRALGPSDQASAIFAAISVFLGLLFAFNAMLLTVPERRQVIADLRLVGARRSAIVQMVMFQALCLGVAASLVGMLAGYALSQGAFRQSPGYLSPAFTLGTHTVLGAAPVLLSLLGGVLATCLASAVPLLDLRGGLALDAVYNDDGVPGNALAGATQMRLALAAICLLAVTIAILAVAPSLVLAAVGLLALATVSLVPLVFALVLRVGAALSERLRRLTILPVALTSLRATTLRSLALACTGAVALFGSVALGGARDDLLRGIASYTSDYADGADIWVLNPSDNQATLDFKGDRLMELIAGLPGVASVHSFQGSFLDWGARRLWVIAWPSSADLKLLDGQLVHGERTAAVARLREGGWLTMSADVAAEHRASVGDTIVLPTPTGNVAFKLAATTTNFGWSPGAVLMSAADYRRAWGTSAPSALGVDLAPGTREQPVREAIEHRLGPGNGLEALSRQTREARIDASAHEGLSQLAEISTLLLLAAILAMAAALGSSIWQRRTSLAGLRLAGVPPARLRRILLTESALMLSAGCMTGAVAGLCGEVAIDAYLKRTTGFPVAHMTAGAGLRALEILALMLVTVLAITAWPTWLTSRVSPTLMLND
jgi:putative ABC transport system permease protein